MTRTLDEQRLINAVETAQDAFWAEIAKSYPEITTGDFSPEDTFAIQEAMTTAARNWVRYNRPLPQPKVGDKIRLHSDAERYPSFVAKAGLTGIIVEVSDKLIAAKIDQPIAGCEEWGNRLEWSEINDDDTVVHLFHYEAEVML